jgi:hypothetical protein
LKSILLFIIFFLSFAVSSQSTNKITKIVIGSGYCPCCGECPIEIIELDINLNYSFFIQEMFAESSLSKGNLTQEMWDSFSEEIEKINTKRFGSKKPFYLPKGHPATIQIFRGTKSKIFYSDIDSFDEELWNLFEKILKSREKLNLKKEDKFNEYLKDNKIYNFLNLGLEKNYR